MHKIATLYSFAHELSYVPCKTHIVGDLSSLTVNFFPSVFAFNYLARLRLIYIRDIGLRLENALLQRLYV